MKYIIVKRLKTFAMAFIGETIQAHAWLALRDTDTVLVGGSFQFIERVFSTSNDPRVALVSGFEPKNKVFAPSDLPHAYRLTFYLPHMLTFNSVGI